MNDHAEPSQQARDSAPMAPQDQQRSPARTLTGIASMIRSGGMDTSDAGWVADALLKAAAAFPASNAEGESTSESAVAAKLHARIAKAQQMVSDLCQGRERWIMRIPAQPDSDPDLVIASGLRAGLEALALITPAQPAQGGAAQVAMGHGNVDVAPIIHEGRVGLLLHPRPETLAVGGPGVLGHDGKDRYWPQSGDVVIWLDGPERGATIIGVLNDPVLRGDALPAAKPAPGEVALTLSPSEINLLMGAVAIREGSLRKATMISERRSEPTMARIYRERADAFAAVLDKLVSLDASLPREEPS